MIRKVLFLAGVLIALSAAPAVAQYNPTLVAPSSAAPGQPITVSGEGAAPGIRITFFLTGPVRATSQRLGSTTSASDGTFSARLTIPAGTVSGLYVLTATGSGFSRATTIQINGVPLTPPGSGPGGGNPGQGPGSGTGTGTGTGVGTGAGAGTGTGAGNGATGIGTGGTGTGTGAGTGTGTGAASGTLPRTGSSSLQPLTIVGALFVAGGGFLILATRKRRHGATATA